MQGISNTSRVAGVRLFIQSGAMRASVLDCPTITIKRDVPSLKFDLYVRYLSVSN